MKTNTLDFDAQALRERILDLAMRGKLVPQDLDDEPASVLLEKIKAEKEELVKEKKIKKSKPLPEITDDEKPFDIPDSWEWVRLGELTAPVEYAMADGPFGSNLKKSDYTLDPEVRIIQLSNIGDQGWKDENVKYTTFEHLKDIQRSEIFPGNIVIAKMMPAGRAIIVPNEDKKYVLSSDAVKFIPNDHIFKDYLLYAINGPVYRNQVNSKLQGSTRPRTSLKKLKSFLIPLPPLPEQSRIVAKIAQLFALLRKVESSTQQYAKLQTLLKSKVLDLAMRGKLVKQDPADEPASVLLEKIKTEKAELVKEKKIKKSKPLPPITDDEKPFDIPDNWEWVRLGDVFEITSSKRVMKSEWRDKGIPFYRAREIVSIKNGRPLKDPIYIDLSTYREKVNISGKPKINDILLTGVGTLGVPYVVNSNKEFYFKDGNIIWLKNLININPAFISYIVQSPSMLKVINNGRGTTVATLTIVRAKNIVIPLPSLEEQGRIVEKINELFNMI